MKRAILLAIALLTACATPAATPAALDGTSWTMLDVAGPTPTIVFADGGASGFTGCNRWSAGIDRSGGGTRFEVIGVTEMACPGPAMATEAAFLSVLERTLIAEIHDSEGGALILFGDEANEIARFARTP